MSVTEVHLNPASTMASHDLLEKVRDVQDAAQRQAKGDDPTAHLDLLQAIQRLQNVASTPTEKFYNLRFQPYQHLCIRMAQEGGILQALASKDGGVVGARELALETGVEESLIGR